MLRVPSNSRAPQMSLSIFTVFQNIGNLHKRFEFLAFFEKLEGVLALPHISAGQQSAGAERWLPILGVPLLFASVPRAPCTLMQSPSGLVLPVWSLWKLSLWPLPYSGPSLGDNCKQAQGSVLRKFMPHGRDHQRESQGGVEAGNCGGMEGAPNQLGAQVGWAQRQKAKNELGLDKARRTEAGMRLQRGNSEETLWERWARGPQMPFQEAGG